MRKLGIILAACVLALTLAGAAGATTITFGEIWTDPPQAQRFGIENDWAAYGITMENTYWYSDMYEPFDGWGVANTLNGGSGYIYFTNAVSAVTFDWWKLSADIYVTAYNAVGAVVDSFYSQGSYGTDTLDGGLISYLEFHDGGGQAAISTLTFESAAVPLPGAVWLLGSGLAGLIGLRRKLSA